MIALLLGLVTSAPAAEPTVLDQAWQKEVAYLLAEKKSLEARVAEGRANDTRRIAEAEADLDRTQGRLLFLQRDAAEREARLAAAERANAAQNAGHDALDNLLAQAVTSLELDAPADDATDADRIAAMQAALKVANQRLAERSKLTVTPGSFFLADGRQVEGRVARAGQVAAWGVSDQGSGALFPLGAGRLQVRAGDDGATAKAVVAGQPPAVAGTFLFESAEKRAEAPPADTWADLIADGGAVGLVILGVGAVLIVLSGLRLLALLRAGGADAAAAEHIAKLLRQGRLDEARAAAKTATGAVGRMLRDLTAEIRLSREDLEVVAERRLDVESRAAERFGTAMLVLASVAPLLGLLGTVSGMIATFDVITEFGAGNPKLLSGGISEALVTTQFGLIVAIPGVLVGNLLNGRAREVLGAVETTALLLLHEVGRGLPDPESEGEGDSRSTPANVRRLRA